MKKTLSFLLSFCLMSIFITGCRAQQKTDDSSVDPQITLQIGNPMMQIDGTEYEIDPGNGTVPIIENERTLLPVRAVVEAMGGAVAWDAQTQTTILAKDDNVILLDIGSNIAFINETQYTLDINIGYVDLMLLHHPDSNDVKAYKAMEKFVAEGKIHSIGLSNWYVEELKEFLPQVDTVPALVQNEIHPYYQENDVIPYIQSLGITVQGWYPLGGRGHTEELLNDPVISDIAAAHGVSSAQVILRWNLQKGVVVIPGSSNPDHIKENTQLYHFSLSDEEMQRINALDRNEKHDWY